MSSEQLITGCTGYCLNLQSYPSWCTEFGAGSPGHFTNEDDIGLDECLAGAQDTIKLGQCCPKYPAALGCVWVEDCAGLRTGEELGLDPSMAAEAQKACDAYCEAATSKPGWCIGAATRTVRRSPHATLSVLASVDPRRTPRLVQTPAADRVISVHLELEEPGFLAGGDGTYAGPSQGDGTYAPLHYDTLTINNSVKSESYLQVLNLQIDRFLQIDEGVEVSPALDVVTDRASILIGSQATVKLVAQNAARLPRLNLGDTEGEYNVVPAVIQLQITEDTKVEASANALVRGVPFALCSQWAARLQGIPDGLEAECRKTAGSGAKRILSGDPLEIGLFLKKLEEEEGFWEKWKYPIIGGAGALVVIVVVVVVVCLRSKRKHRKHKKAKKDGSNSYSYSYSCSYSTQA
jgi:hypothetical protein